MTGDFNGDARTDILYINTLDYNTQNGTPYDHFVVYLSNHPNSDGVRPSQDCEDAYCTVVSPRITPGNYYVGDYNGDGRTDTMGLAA
jgi:hypothetical protein